MKLLIESYFKFMKTRTRYFKSPILTLDREGFHQIGQFEKDKDFKTIDTINNLLKTREINSGHVVWRTVYNLWGFPWAEIWHNSKILDKYGKEIK